MASIYQQLPQTPSFNPGWAPADKYDDYQLTEAVGNGYGVIGYYGGNSHEVIDALKFMEDQYKRFGMMPPQKDFLHWCWDQAFYYIDQMDPYALLSGCTDVIKTEEAYYYQYAVSNDGDEWVEVAPNDIETFRLWEDGEKSWEVLMGYPGLQEYFSHIYDYFMDHFEFIKADDHPECYETEWKYMKQYGPNTQHLAHLGIWSAIMWMCSPLPEAKAWRYEFHPIFKICYDFGACVLHGWTFHDPRYFIRQDRKAQTCSNCGIDEYCVDLTQTRREMSEYLCEHCLSGGLPFPGRSCGTKLCENTGCPNHPVAKAPDTEKSVARREILKLAADERFGPLRQLQDGSHRQVRELPGYIKLNEIAISQQAKSIADTVSNVFAALIGPQ